MKPIFTFAFLLAGFSAFSQYNFYFGNIHSHSSYSDGNKDSTTSGYYTPADDYNYAKASYHMDFLGVSEHNHFSSINNPGMHVGHYGMGLYQADTANHNGSFVAMYGLEWGTISQGGHVVAYGLPGLIGWESGSGAWGSTNNYNIFCAKGDFAGFWPIVKSYPTAFCTLAHPQTNDYGNLLDAAGVYNANTDSVVVGVAIRSGSAMSTTTNYTDPAATSYESKYLRALAKGYHVGPTIDHDNHYSTFGRTNQSRTVVLATSLHRDSIMAAYKANRFYASDDWNTQVNFTVNGNFMGSHFITNANSSITVTVNDPDAPGNPNDNINTIEIYYGIAGSGTNATILTSNAGSTSLNYSHTSTINTSYYYFAKITQVDGDMIWTAPVWVFRDAVVLPIVLNKFNGMQVNDGIKLNWTTTSETNMSHFNIEHSVDGQNFTEIGKVFSKFQNSSVPVDYAWLHTTPKKGLNFYRLKQFDLDGKFKYSYIIPVPFNYSIVQSVKINPNPVHNNLNLAFAVEENCDLVCKIYNVEGREIRSITTAAHAGKNNIMANVSDLPNGNYILVIICNNERIAETRFIKQ
ncbi:MAG: T9SS type A sorting domain-containing protein [Ferruginibacter sp.]